VRARSTGRSRLVWFRRCARSIPARR